MIRFFLILHILFFIILNNNSVYSQIQNKIIANVESQIISSYELKNKIRTLIFLSGQKISQENIDRIKKRAIAFLIDLKLKEETINKYNVNIESNENTNIYLNNLSRKYGTDINGLKRIFLENQLDFDIYLNEINIEFAWNELIYSIYNDKIVLNEKEIDKQLKKIVEKSKSVMEYKLSEIQVAIEDSSKKDELIKEIQNQISEIGFENTAIKFSSGISSIDGGSLGWISSSSLSPRILELVRNININDVSNPIIQGQTILFIKLLDRRSINVESLNIDKIKNNLITKKKNEILNLYSNNHLSKIKNNALIEIK